MRLERLVLRNFRNLREVEIAPHPGYNLLLGPNGSGKTNLCEALYFAARGELLKGERQRELIAFGESLALIELELDHDSLKIVLDGAAKMKRVEVNGKPAGPHFPPLLRVVAFTASDLQVIKGEPQLRRAFLDGAIGELDPEYKRYLRRYERVVSGKNYLLRQGQGRPDQELLAVYQEELAGLGARLLARRLAYLRELNEELRRLRGRLELRPLELEYLSSLEGLPEAKEPERLESWLARGLERLAEEEAKCGFSLVGPHRDDLRFISAGIDLRRFGSQGEQRLAIIQAKLAQCELHRQRFGDYPILILDDLLSELDPRAGRLLLGALPKGVQAFLTATEPPPALEGLVDRTYLLEEGRVREWA